MTSWILAIAIGVAVAVLGLLHNIFLEVRSIRRMMNDAHPDFQSDGGTDD